MSRIYTTKTPSLKATIADIRNLDVKKLTINGENISTAIEEAKTTILDERGTLANDDIDIWNSYISKDENGNVIINKDAKPKVHTMLVQDQSPEFLNAKPFLQQATSIIDNQVLDKDNNHLMFWQTSGLADSYYLHEALDWTFPIVNFESDLNSLKNGFGMFFNISTLKTFKSNLSSLVNGNGMFQTCYNLSEFECDNLNSLENGTDMFNMHSHSNSFIESFSYDLPSLVEGKAMFNNMPFLKSFKSDLSSLEDGQVMFFYCNSLKDFDIKHNDLSSLTNGEAMFEYCYEITAFDAKLSSLTNGKLMFDKCTSLSYFGSDISSLANGTNMFSECKLNSQSVMNILHFIPDRTGEASSTITIGIGISNSDENKQAFAEECYCDSWQDLNDEFSNKNWIVTWQFNGPVTYSLRQPQIPVYVKLEEVEEDRISSHTSPEGDKFYNISWYHESNGNNEGYTMYDSMDVALEALGVIPKV